MLLLDYKRMLVDAINFANKTEIPFDQAKFGIPHDVYTIPGANPAVTNTLIRIDMGGKETTWAYNRVTLTESLRDHQYNTRSLLKLQSITDDPAATVAASITAHYGYPMEAEDIIGSSVVMYNGTLSFEISAKSIRYRKERVSFKLDGTYVRHLGDYWRLVELTRVEPEIWFEDRVDFFKMPDTAPRADMLTYGNDYTPIANLLSQFVGTVPWYVNTTLVSPRWLLELAYGLKSVDGLPWVYSATGLPAGGGLNLLDSWISYNGETSKIVSGDYPQGTVPLIQKRVLDCVNRDYSHVMLIRPNSKGGVGADKTLSPSTMILHYNR